MFLCRKYRAIFNTTQVIGGGNIEIFVFINTMIKEKVTDNIFWTNIVAYLIVLR